MTTQTPVRPVPAETPIRPGRRERVTEIRPSEAIRLGTLTYPNQGRIEFADPETRKACALGAMAIGYGWDPEKNKWGGLSLTESHLPLHLDAPCGCGYSFMDGTAIQTLYHLNDWHDWKRESIADWLAEQGL